MKTTYDLQKHLAEILNDLEKADPRLVALFIALQFSKKLSLSDVLEVAADPNKFLD